MKWEILIGDILLVAGGLCFGVIIGFLKGRSIYRMTWAEVKKYRRP